MSEALPPIEYFMLPPGDLLASLKRAANGENVCDIVLDLYESATRRQVRIP